MKLLNNYQCLTNYHGREVALPPFSFRREVIFWGSRTLYRHQVALVVLTQLDSIMCLSDSIEFFHNGARTTNCVAWKAYGYSMHFR
jgi:hypothetical protein